MKSNKYKFTILTPTYNRGKLLYRLYDSLNNQGFVNFEWIIVDDGSTDNTEKIVEDIKNRSTFDIVYVKKENGGKPSAHNEGVKVANSELTIICDDDDFFVSDALFKINCVWEQYKNENIGGVIAHRGLNENKIIGRDFPNVTYAGIEEIFHNEYFDTVQIYRTDLLKNNLFPITDGEKFIPEIWLWKELDRLCNLIVLNEIIEICVYRDDGLTKTNSQNMWNNPIGYSYYFKQRYEECSGVDKVKYYAAYAGLRKYKGYSYEKASIYIDLLSRPIQWGIAFRLGQYEKD